MATPNPLQTPKKPLVLTNVRPGQVRIAGLTFQPGDRKTIPEQFADAVRKAPVFGRYLLEGDVRLPEAPEPPKVPSLADLDDPKALAMVRLEDSLETLAAWAESENATGKPRRAVLDMIRERAESIARK